MPSLERVRDCFFWNIAYLLQLNSLSRVQADRSIWCSAQDKFQEHTGWCTLHLLH